MALLENPAVATPLKGPNATQGPSVTVKDINELESRLRGGTPKFAIEEHPVDLVRPIKVGIIGAGLTGLSAGALLPAKLPGLDLRIYDKNADVGGTWFENTYPGVRCDVPAHAYQSTFSPNIRWTEEFAQGAEIRDYWQDFARKYNVYRYVRLKQRVQKAEWLPEEAKWKVTIEHLDGSHKVYEEKLDILLNAIGHFNAWQLPDYEGIRDFKGPLFGVAGPALHPALASHVDHYARNPTWIAEAFTGSKSSGVRRLEPNLFSEEQLESFKDPKEYLKYRKSVERGYFQRFGAIFKDSPENKQQLEQWTELMKNRVAEKPELQDQIIPDFPPNCRRPTPGPGYLEALTKENVSYIRTKIQRFTEKGIVTEDGTEREVDVVICSTGANTDHAPPFSIIANGIDLNGTVPNSMENVITYVAKVLRKVRSQGIKTIAPSKEATDDFVEYCDNFYPRTVWSANCSSWYNGGTPGARIHGLFPGSAAAANYIRRDPRWEDFEYTRVNPSGNRFAYFGNGWTSRETDPDADLTPHLRLPEEVDLRSLNEGWWDV
ncbi:hypothetical protein N7470_002415 [Penicillium chermesinum]|nr:hypothetical protein N7470_002415 [Penicillium chermesinum]